jgi:16S rRNA (cytidine1402-2'-O)-methyltransferase
VRFPVSIIPGALYIVATPIGNLADVTNRALDVLTNVDLILAEDTRHSAKLLQHYGIHTPMLVCHDHNERRQVGKIIRRLQEKESVALISDAGTPLISDPGFPLVAAAHAEGIRVIPVPGPSAVISALSIAGLAPDRFVFEGYLPARQAARRKRLNELAGETRTLVFFEAPHRLAECIEDMVRSFGPDRNAALMKELTKLHETVRRDTLIHLLNWCQQDNARLKGEFVLIVQGASGNEPKDAEAARVLKALMKALSIKKSASLAAEILHDNKNRLYRLALKLRGPDGG